MSKLQFRVLYREFLFRMVDLELLSSDALGDSNRLLGQFASLLIFLSVLLAIPSLGAGGNRAPGLALFFAWSMEHFLIATTMLVVGLFAVLSWDSTFPNRRDVMVLAPLPVRTRTLFLAKVAGVGTALSLTVALLHCLAGLVWPLALGTQGTPAFDVPALNYLPAAAPVDAAGLEPLLRHDLTPTLPPEMGVVIGVVKHGVRRIYTYGTAQPDSIYQIASISKTFTGLLLAEMTVQGKVRLDQPVRELLPPGTVRKPAGPEITLRDLAIHRSGLPPWPDNMHLYSPPNPGADYHPADLYAYFAKHGVAKPANPRALYSNLAYGLLGQVLADRAGMTYPELLAQQITGPMGLRDTATNLSPEQETRLIQAYRRDHRPVAAWELDALNGAGGIRSTAADMLTYLEANLHAATPALRLSHQLQGDLASGVRIALAWAYFEDTGTYLHDGAISGYTSHAFFNPKGDYAAIVLVNQAPSYVRFADVVALHIRARLVGEPAVSLASVTIPASGGFLTLIRYYVAYWCTMLAAGIFVFCCVLALQGFAAQLLPRRLFLRVSSFLQLATFCLLVCVYALQPMFPDGLSLFAANGRGLLAWSPSYWFLGLFQQLTGSPALAPLAHRAWVGLAAVLCGTAIAYALSYLRTLRKIVEEPDILPGARGGTWLPRFGNALQTAIVQFSIRGLLRSRQHRIILAFYLGIGFALTIFLLKVPAVREQLADAPVTDAWGQVNEPLLAASIVMLIFWMVGTRVVFAFPLDLPANWIFRVTATRGGPQCLAAVRRALFCLSTAGVWIGSAALCLWLWPWRPAVGHLLVLALIASILADICLYGFRKIPFTCSYLPGKSQVHMAVLGALALLWFITLSVKYERQALDDYTTATAMFSILSIAAAIARWLATSDEPDLRFEEALDPAVQVLGLTPPTTDHLTPDPDL